MKIILNGHFHEESNATLQLSDRGFQYGDGFFETILYSSKSCPLWSEHLERITTAFELFDFDINQLPNLLNEIKTLCSKNNLKKARIKIMFWRKEGGLFTPSTNNFNYVIITKENTQRETYKNQIDFYPKPINSFTPFSFLKTISSLKYVLVGKYMQSRHLDEIIILDINGYISETLYCNIFWIKNNKLFTPSLKTGCVAGVMRKKIIQNHSHQSTIDEGLFKPEELINADAIFLTNALGIYPVKNINTSSFDISHPLIDIMKNIIE